VEGEAGEREAARASEPLFRVQIIIARRCGIPMEYGAVPPTQAQGCARRAQTAKKAAPKKRKAAKKKTAKKAAPTKQTAAAKKATVKEK
jgi:hypothetical protein